MTNTLIGAFVALIHDIPDVFIAWTRAWGESEYKSVGGYSFAISLVIFLYTRLILLPYAIYVSTFKLEVYATSPYV